MTGTVVASGGEHAPPPFTAARLLTESDPVSWLAVLLLAAAVAYVVGVRRLRARGDRWSPWRTASFVGGGLGAIGLATLSGLAAYDETLFSVHMVQHMVLSMVAPVFLALGAPVTLALRTLPRGARRWLLAVLHSRVARVVTFPLVPWVLFVGSPFALYFSGWYPATLENEALHALMHVHFLVAGSLFVWPLVGLDPVPGRVPYPLRALLVLVALPFHAFLGIGIMSSSTLIAAEHYRSLGLDWVDPLADQRIGGGLLWASGDLVGLALVIACVVQWMRASEREAVREDRRLDRLEAQAGRGSAAVATISGPSDAPGGT